MTSTISSGINLALLQDFFQRAGAYARNTGNDQDSPLRGLMDALFEAALFCREGKILHANPAACALFGMPWEGLSGKRLSERISFKKTIKPEPPRALPKAVPCEQTATLLRPDNQEVEVVLRTISCDEAKQEQLFLVKEQLAGILPVSDSAFMDGLPWPLMRLDTKLRYLHCNSALSLKVAPFTRHLPGKPLAELGWPAAFCRELEQAAWAMETNASPRQLQLAWQRNRCSHRFVAELIPERTPAGALRSIFIAIHDAPAIEQKNVTALLQHAREARDQALAASHARDAFFSWVSHELRTPLNGIQSWAHILETYVSAATNDSPLIARALHGIRTGIAQQLRLIEELLDVSRVIDGKLPLTCHAFALRAVAQSAVDGMQVAAQARHIQLSCQYPAEEIQLESDPCRVQQALHLVLSHAVESAPRHGSIRLSVRQRRRHAAICIVHHCSDAGPGGMRREGSPLIGLKNSRQQMNLFLAGCLAEHLGGSLKTRLSGKTGDISHTILLPSRAGSQEFMKPGGI